LLDEFLCDPLAPVAGTFDAAAMARGEPGLPRQFQWRGTTIEITSVLCAWKETGGCSSGGGERYIRKHWYEVVSSHGTMKIYFERQARGKASKRRWWLHSITRSPGVSS